jgi:hypothetical protein
MDELIEIRLILASLTSIDFAAGIKNKKGNVIARSETPKGQVTKQSANKALCKRGFCFTSPEHTRPVIYPH